MNEEVHKVRGPAIAVALSILLIAGFVALCLWLPASEFEDTKGMIPVVSGPSPAVLSHLSWPEASYLEVRAYYSREPFSVIKDGVPESMDSKDGVLLNQDQERRLITAVTSSIEPYIGADCLVPRHAFVFFDPLDRPVANLIVCFDCVWVEGGPSDMPDIGALADLVIDLGLPLGPNNDVEAFRERFKDAQEKGKGQFGDLAGREMQVPANPGGPPVRLSRSSRTLLHVRLLSPDQIDFVRRELTVSRSLSSVRTR